jgi:hypothetical protein
MRVLVVACLFAGCAIEPHDGVYVGELIGKQGTCPLPTTISVTMENSEITSWSWEQMLPDCLANRRDGTTDISCNDGYPEVPCQDSGNFRETRSTLEVHAAGTLEGWFSIVAFNHMKCDVQKFCEGSGTITFRQVR